MRKNVYHLNVGDFIIIDNIEYYVMALFLDDIDNKVIVYVEDEDDNPLSFSFSNNLYVQITNYMV